MVPWHISHKHNAGVPFTLDTHPILTLIVDSVFHNNSVARIGVALYVAFYNYTGTSQNYDGILSQVIITNSNFTENGGIVWRLYIYCTAYLIIIKPLFYTSIENCKIGDNYKPPNIDGPIVDFINVEHC